MNRDSDSDSLMFPSQAWFAEYEDSINNNDEYAERGTGWGIEFNGHFVFEMTEMPIDEMDRDAMPEYLREELALYVTETTDRGYVGRAFCGLEDGICTGAYLIERLDDVNNGFLLSATTETWKSLLEHEISVIEGLKNGDFELVGDRQKLRRYSDALIRLTELTGQPNHEFVDETFTMD